MGGNLIVHPFTSRYPRPSGADASGVGGAATDRRRSPVSARRETTRSRELVRPCDCGRPVLRYVTSDGTKAAPYCVECARLDPMARGAGTATAAESAGP